MAYTPSTHDPLCTCEQDLANLTVDDLRQMLQSLRRKRYAGLPFTQAEVDLWN